MNPLTDVMATGTCLLSLTVLECCFRVWKSCLGLLRESMKNDSCSQQELSCYTSVEVCILAYAIIKCDYV